jgi:hypothetical protein
VRSSLLTLSGDTSLTSQAYISSPCFRMQRVPLYNTVEIISLDNEAGAFPAEPQFSFTHPYPCTKILFIPDKDCTKVGGGAYSC